MSRTYKHELTGAKAATHGCRNNGPCEYCESNRTISTKRAGEKAKDEFALFSDTGDGWDLLGSDAY
jgi:hypothetical protein